MKSTVLIRGVIGVIIALITNVTVKAQAQLPEPTPVQITIYSSFEPLQLKKAFADISKSAGIDLLIETSEPDLLLGRLLSEGQKTKADLLLLPDFVRLNRAAMAGLLQPIAPLDAFKEIPNAYRDPQNHWLGLASFGYIIVTASKGSKIETYQDLGKLGLSSKICLPSLSRLSNRTLIAALIHHLGPKEAKALVEAMVAASIRLPYAAGEMRSIPDTSYHDLLKAFAESICETAIVSSAMLARIADNNAAVDKDALNKIGVIWPNQKTWGTIIDIVGVGVPSSTRSSERTEAIWKLLTYLVSDVGQRSLAEALCAYPIEPGVPLPNSVTRWGPFKVDDTPFTTLAPLIEQATNLLDQTGWP